MRREPFCLLAIAFPAAVFAESGNTSLRFTGAPIDGGQTCVSCHAPRQGPNPGSLVIAVSPYSPGVQQTIRVTVSDPTSSRWGFQLTSRLVSDETKQAGTFGATTIVQDRCDDGSRFGAVGPCGGSHEFAEHVDAPRSATGAGFTFDVPWTPPINEAGDVRIYAAAVAADGDNTAAGDRTYTAGRVVSATGACNATKRPTLQTAQNGASFLPAISSNAMVTIKGLDFQVPGRSREVGLGDFVNNAFPKELACVAVEIAGQRVPISYVQQDQINVQAPTLPASGSIPMIVILNPDRQNELRSDLGMITTSQAFAPAFFMLPKTSSVAAQFAGTTNLVANSADFPTGKAAKPGDLVTLYATGLGPTNPAVKAGDLATGQARITTPITVMLGNLTLSDADVLYAGLSPGSISGLYQINIRIPNSTPPGDIPIKIAIGGFSSQQQATIPILLP